MQKTHQSGPIITGTMNNMAEMLSFASKRSYPANHTLLYSGQEVEYLYYIVSGEILISNYASPDSLSHLFILREESMLGLIGLFNPNKSLATWLTLKPCTCYLFSKKEIYENVPRKFLLNMMEQLASMSSSMTRRFAQGNVKRLEVRLARLFVHLLDACPPAKDCPAGARAIIPRLTQEMASDLLGMHPVTLNRILATLRNQGVLGRFTKNRLEVFNLEALEKYANGEMPILEY